MLVVNTVHNKHTLQYIVRYLQGLHFSLSKLPLVKKKKKDKKSSAFSPSIASPAL